MLMVARSHERDTTKGGHADGIPIATELLPFLRIAMAASPSGLVFPRPDGTMMRRDVNLEMTLRRAMGRAGVVEGYKHTCRKKGCGHEEAANDQETRRCPKDRRKLWVKPVVRPIRIATRRSRPSSTGTSLRSTSGRRSIASASGRRWRDLLRRCNGRFRERRRWPETASKNRESSPACGMERETGFEPATLSLGS